jgi:hypothetical protein
MTTKQVGASGMVKAANEELQRSHPGLAKIRWSADSGYVPGVGAKQSDFLKYKEVIDRVLLTHEHNPSLDATGK